MTCRLQRYLQLRYFARVRARRPRNGALSTAFDLEYEGGGKAQASSPRRSSPRSGRTTSRDSRGAAFGPRERIWREALDRDGNPLLKTKRTYLHLLYDSKSWMIDW